MSTKKRCAKCKEPKPRTAFGRQKAAKDGLYYSCKECHHTESERIIAVYREKGLCRCGNDLDPSLPFVTCARCRGNHNTWTKKNAAHVLDFNRKLNEANKKIVFDHYGNQCSCPGGCDVKDSDWLSVDHVNNDGAEHRKTTGGGSRFYKWLIKHNFPPGFRLLCFNCNCSRAFSRLKNCPHERKQPTPTLPLVDSV